MSWSGHAVHRMQNLRVMLKYARWRGRQATRDVLLRATATGDIHREDLARRYLQGDGIEIGAMHKPLRVPFRTSVRYVDMMTRDELLDRYGPSNHFPAGWVVETDVVDDGQSLRTFASDSVDFIVANHMLEHTEDPIAALEAFLRVVRVGGVLFVTLPDARRSFDALRPRTSIEHLVCDHVEGPAVSREDHYREWAAVECLTGDEVERRIEQFACEDAHHHFHVWELETFLSLLLALDLPMAIEHAGLNDDEFTVITRRRK
jgi:SAM-dependent methyltransferase